MKFMHSRNAFLAFISIAAGLAPATLIAGNSIDRVAETVVYSDLDISLAADAKVLYGRLKSASRRVCGLKSLRISGTVRILADQRQCYRHSLETAVASLDKPALSRIHASYQSRPVAPLTMTANR